MSKSLHSKLSNIEFQRELPKNYSFQRSNRDIVIIVMNDSADGTVVQPQIVRFDVQVKRHDSHFYDVSAATASSVDLSKSIFFQCSRCKQCDQERYQTRIVVFQTQRLLVRLQKRHILIIGKGEIECVVIQTTSKEKEKSRNHN